MPFTGAANIENNPQLRDPQREAWIAVRAHFANGEASREAGIVLPVGCGKSGLITITPFATAARRVLVIAPGLRIKNQLFGDFDPSGPENFYERFSVTNWPNGVVEVARVEGSQTNIDDLNHAQVVVTNIQQLQGDDNRWLGVLPNDFFDLILIDEAHHNTAESWVRILDHFPAARIVNYSATPRRADGQVMSGGVIYSYPVVQAILRGYVKRLRATMLNPARLTYVDPSDGQERTITAEEVIRLGGESAAFRRGIVMSNETLHDIVEVSINELRRLRQVTGEQNLKIISSALSQNHCIQIVRAFSERGMRADFVHSLEGQDANDRVFAALNNNDLDVIVQARMLGEGFDHPLLAVAMVGSIFSNLSPFVQFVGRIMRALDSGQPQSVRNQGVVVFHAGSNAAARWDDFRDFSQADQDFFRHLLPVAEELDFRGEAVLEREPGNGGIIPVDVLGSAEVAVQQLTLTDDPEVVALLDELAARGVTPEQAAAELRRRPVQRQQARRAAREALPDFVSNGAARILRSRNLAARGRTLDPARRRDNLVYLITEINRRLAQAIGRNLNDRANWTLDDNNRALAELENVLREIEGTLPSV